MVAVMVAGPELVNMMVLMAVQAEEAGLEMGLVEQEQPIKDMMVAMILPLLVVLLQDAVEEAGLELLVVLV
jgi:hypothetical protein